MIEQSEHPVASMPLRDVDPDEIALSVRKEAQQQLAEVQDHLKQKTLTTGVAKSYGIDPDIYNHASQLHGLHQPEKITEKSNTERPAFLDAALNEARKITSFVEHVGPQEDALGPSHVPSVQKTPQGHSL